MWYNVALLFPATHLLTCKTQQIVVHNSAVDPHYNEDTCFLSIVTV